METTINKVIHIGKREFKQKIHDYTFSKEWQYRGELPAVVDFYADWCAPCRMVSPLLDELAAEYTGKIMIYKVNTEKDPEVAKAFGVSSIPTLLFIPMEGKPRVIRGAQSKQSLKGNMDDLLPKEEKPLLKRFLSFKWQEKL